MPTPFIPAGELFAPSDAVVVPAGGTATARLVSYDGEAFGILRILPDAGPASHGVTMRAVSGGDTTLLGDTPLALVSKLFRFRALRHPMVVPTGTSLDVTFTNPTAAPVTAHILLEALTAAQLDALRAHRAASNLPARQSALLWGSVDVAASQERKRLEIGTRGTSCLVTRLAASAATPAGAPATGNVRLGVTAQGRDLVKVATIAQLDAFCGETREIVPGLRMGPSDVLTTYVTETTGAPVVVSVLAECLR